MSLSAQSGARRRGRWALVWGLGASLAFAGGCDDGASGAGEASDGAVDAQELPPQQNDATVEEAPDAEVALPPVEFDCPGAVAQRYDPLGEPEDLTSFPDDFWTVEADTATGLQVQIAEDTPWLLALRERFRPLYAEMNALDGFGTSAPIFLSFDGPIAPMTFMQPGLVLLDLGDDEARAVPYEPVVLDEGRTLALWPAWPLRPGTLHAVVAQAGFKDAEGQKICPSPTLRALLGGELPDARFEPLQAKVRQLVGKAGIEPSAVQALSLFTTQTIHTGADASVRVAEDIQGRRFAFEAAPECELLSKQRHCEGRFRAYGYRDAAGRVVDGEPQEEWSMPVSIWLPRSGEGPWPTYILAHGLGGDRSLGEVVGQLTGDNPVVVVAIDAVAHGEHPAGAGGEALDLINEFFAFDLVARTIDVPRLRDNFRQSTFDKLQLLQLILQNPDLDGDGQPDVDLDRLGYFGVSLGGIMGPEFLALSGAIHNVVLGMPGARLSRVIRDSPAFQIMHDVYLPRSFEDGFKERIYGAVQTLGERGDPVNFATHVLHDRLPVGGERVPDVLMLMAMDDEIVPNSATMSLARALQVPVVAPVLRAIDFLPSADTIPVEGNINGQTGGVAQYKEVWLPDRLGRYWKERATHENLMWGREPIKQVKAFFESFSTQGRARIIDPSGG